MAAIDLDLGGMTGIGNYQGFLGSSIRGGWTGPAADSTLLYNLDAIISVGYRVNSKRAVRFHQWATRTLRRQLVSGYTLNQRKNRPYSESPLPIQEANAQPGLVLTGARSEIM